ncbi:Hypothetical_protein [Hexamita inflata]|uniref:Hypothetical_protein n=1 Tax=Hexamita inflata TaxID=28002 RepID=A0AA86U585_9EUKA|nr:Hypothetical protein HINF_LOCUS27526 [Hexamita inflata]CAI9963871.1 Hypothetical protein HINF_LOCUS51516 [Hexamita inflata]
MMNLALQLKIRFTILRKLCLTRKLFCSILPSTVDSVEQQIDLKPFNSRCTYIDSFLTIQQFRIIFKKYLMYSKQFWYLKQQLTLFFAQISYFANSFIKQIGLPTSGIGVEQKLSERMQYYSLQLFKPLIQCKMEAQINVAPLKIELEF